MSTSEDAESPPESRASVLFQTLLVQQVRSALVCLGQMPSDKGDKSIDLEGARFFIDVLEMLEVKTKGNLDDREQAMLKQSLTSLRLAFVEVSNAAGSKSPPAAPPAEASTGAAASASSSSATAAEDSDSRKKFSKKY